MKIPKYKLYLAFSDFILVFITLTISYYVIVTVEDKNFNYFLHFRFLLIILFLMISIFFVFFQQANNLYKINVFLSKATQTVNLLKSIVTLAIVLIVTSFLFKITDILTSRIFVFSATLLSFFVLYFSRVVFLQKLYKLFARNQIINKNILIIGAGKAGQILAKKLKIAKGLGIRVVGFIDDNRKQGEEVFEGVEVLGTIDDLQKIKEQNNIIEVIVAIDNISYERLIEILQKCNKLDLLVKISSDLFEIIPQKIEIEKYNDIPIVNAAPQIHSDISLFFKRVIDFIGALLGIIVLLPLLIIVSLLILFSSRGPIIYKQVRIGKNGKPFNFYKFRSMRIVESKDEEIRKIAMIEFMKNNKRNNDSDSKVVDESRITAIGRFIRKTSIDELPQLINVLKGEMSLVGPRPCLPYEYENLEEWQKNRFNVLPGCTGVWQVLGRSEVSFKDSVVLDLYYINNMSPWFDLQLILKTIPVMIFSKGGK
ncbi:MAG: sugar transferase [Ignavibacteriales bacterium]